MAAEIRTPNLGVNRHQAISHLKQHHHMYSPSIFSFEASAPEGEPMTSCIEGLCTAGNLGTSMASDPGSTPLI